MLFGILSEKEMALTPSEVEIIGGIFMTILNCTHIFKEF
nr:MAG TPA: hypothetical protein [Caudoviricetes sp.]